MIQLIKHAIIILFMITHHMAYALAYGAEPIDNRMDKIAQEFNRPVHYVHEWMTNHPNSTSMDMYVECCKEQGEELIALNIEHINLQVLGVLPSLTRYREREEIIEERNIEIMKQCFEKSTFDSPHLIRFKGTRIPKNVWQRLMDDHDITEHDIAVPIEFITDDSIYPLRFIPPCFFEGMCFKSLELQDQRLIALPDSIKNSKNTLTMINIQNVAWQDNPNSLNTFPDALFECQNLRYIYISNIGVRESAQSLDEAFPSAYITFSYMEKDVISADGHTRKEWFLGMGGVGIYSLKPGKLVQFYRSSSVSAYHRLKENEKKAIDACHQLSSGLRVTDEDDTLFPMSRKNPMDLALIAQKNL